MWTEKNNQNKDQKLIREILTKKADINLLEKNRDSMHQIFIKASEKLHETQVLCEKYETPKNKETLGQSEKEYIKAKERYDLACEKLNNALTPSRRF